MINIEKLLESKRVEVSYINTDVDKEFVRNFRKEHHLTQVALANVLGVTKKTIEKWEQGVNNVNGSSAVLLRLLENNPELIHQLYSVKYGVEGQRDKERYKVIETKVVTEVKKSHKTSIMMKMPLVAMF